MAVTVFLSDRNNLQVEGLIWLMVSEGFIMEEKVMWNDQMLTSQEIRNQRRRDPGQVTPQGPALHALPPAA